MVAIPVVGNIEVVVSDLGDGGAGITAVGACRSLINYHGDLGGSGCKDDEGE